MFLYVLAMPTDSFYRNVMELINEKWGGKEDKGREGSMKRVRGSVEELQSKIKDLPFWRITFAGD
jgi:hypothetical protein